MASPCYPGICLSKLQKFSINAADVPTKVSPRYIKNTLRNRVKITRGLEIQYKDLISLAK
jgi:hypothetical protein